MAVRGPSTSVGVYLQQGHLAARGPFSSWEQGAHYQLGAGDPIAILEQGALSKLVGPLEASGPSSCERAL